MEQRLMQQIDGLVRAVQENGQGEQGEKGQGGARYEQEQFRSYLDGERANAHGRVQEMLQSLGFTVDQYQKQQQQGKDAVESQVAEQFVALEEQLTATQGELKAVVERMQQLADTSTTVTQESLVQERAFMTEFVIGRLQQQEEQQQQGKGPVESQAQSKEVGRGERDYTEKFVVHAIQQALASGQWVDQVRSNIVTVTH
jgi:hypothetical protein